jgi:hypothetical protein
MRITRDILHKAARELVDERVKAERDILAIYLCGSTLEEEPLLGDSGDIDLVFIHYNEAETRREIVRLNDQIHLDILHHPNTVYNQPRQLRTDPWLGTTVFDCKVLYDPQHFMDFTVASVRGQFDMPENVLARAKIQVKQARQIWTGLQLNPPSSGAPALAKYLESLERAANAIVSLNGHPLTERRFLARLPYYAEAAGVPGMAVGMLGLLGGLSLEKKILSSWLPAWEAAYRAVNAFPDAPVQLHPYRLVYNRVALETWIESPQPAYALWLLLRTWTMIVCTLGDENFHIESWQHVSRYLGLIEENFEQRLSALDAYLDTIEEVPEDWGREHGIKE